MMHKAWSSIGEVPYCFSRSPVKLQGHTGQKIADFDPNWAFAGCNSSLNSPMALKWCTKLGIGQMIYVLLYYFLNVLFGWSGLAVNPHSFLHPWRRILCWWWPSTLHFNCVEVASSQLCRGLLFLGFFLLGWHVSPGMLPRGAGYPLLPLHTPDIWDLPPCAFSSLMLGCLIDRRECMP